MSARTRNLLAGLWAVAILMLVLGALGILRGGAPLWGLGVAWSVQAALQATGMAPRG